MREDPVFRALMVANLTRRAGVWDEGCLGIEGHANIALGSATVFRKVCCVRRGEPEVLSSIVKAALAGGKMAPAVRVVFRKCAPGMFSNPKAK